MNSVKSKTQLAQKQKTKKTTKLQKKKNMNWLKEEL